MQHRGATMTDTRENANALRSTLSVDPIEIQRAARAAEQPLKGGASPDATQFTHNWAPGVPS